jgi:hypothetical protein
VDHDPLSNNEKQFIIKRVKKYQAKSGIIHWKYIIRDLGKKFDKIRSENKIKNFWNSSQEGKEEKERKERERRGR